MTLTMLHSFTSFLVLLSGRVMSSLFKLRVRKIKLHFVETEFSDY